MAIESLRVLLRSHESICKARPKAVSRAKPSPNRPGQALGHGYCKSNDSRFRISILVNKVLTRFSNYRHRHTACGIEMTHGLNALRIRLTLLALSSIGHRHPQLKYRTSTFLPWLQGNQCINILILPGIKHQYFNCKKTAEAYVLRLLSTSGRHLR
jgi:hypothetical protein